MNIELASYLGLVGSGLTIAALFGPGQLLRVCEGALGRSGTAGPSNNTGLLEHRASPSASR